MNALHSRETSEMKCQPETEACINSFNYVLLLLANEVATCDAENSPNTSGIMTSTLGCHHRHCPESSECVLATSKLIS